MAIIPLASKLSFCELASVEVKVKIENSIFFMGNQGQCEYSSQKLTINFFKNCKVG
jgi:hypothetical protein